MTAGAAWTVDLAEPAEADFAAIISWTAGQFGDTQARVYTETLGAAKISGVRVDFSRRPARAITHARLNLVRTLFTCSIVQHWTDLTEDNRAINVL